MNQCITGLHEPLKKRCIPSDSWDFCLILSLLVDLIAYISPDNSNSRDSDGVNIERFFRLIEPLLQFRLNMTALEVKFKSKIFGRSKIFFTQCFIHSVPKGWEGGHSSFGGEICQDRMKIPNNRVFSSVNWPYGLFSKSFPLINLTT